MPAQSVSFGHSSRSGIANSADSAGTKAPKAAPPEAPRMVTARAHRSRETMVTRTPWKIGSDSVWRTRKRLPRGADGSRTSRAPIKPIPSMRVATLEYRFLTFLVTCGAYPMRRLGALCVWLQDIGQRSSDRHLLQFIPLFLSLPCFEASNLCFLMTYRLNQCRALVLQRHQRALGINDFPLELYLPLPKGGGVTQSYHGLGDVLQRLEAAKRRSDGGHVRH
jgi:hypothetical protein